MPRTHRYDVTVNWTGDEGTGTSARLAYRRTFEVLVDGRPPLGGSADPMLHGEADRWNPEELLVSALSSCHMLWYLHLCADAGVVVTGYRDQPHGEMVETRDGGRFTEVLLRPRVSVAAPEMVEPATALHREAHARCFIANSVNFPVRLQPEVTIPAGGAG